MKSLDQFATDFFDNSLRTEVVIPLCTSIIDDTVPYCFEQELATDAEEMIAAIGLGKEFEKAELEEISEEIFTRCKSGFLIKFATPVPQNIRYPRVSYSCSWSYYSTKWIYKDTFENCLKEGLRWREAYIEEAIKQQKMRDKEKSK